MSERERIIRLARAKRDEIEARYGLRLVGLVGSIARGEERPDSDADFVVDVTGKPTLFDLVGAQEDLQAVLGRKVDLVLRRSMKPERRAYMERDLRPL